MNYIYSRIQGYCLGRYPSLSLKDARKEHLRLQQKVMDGIDPSAERIAKKNALKQEELEKTLTYAKVSQEWFTITQSKNSENTKYDVQGRLNLYIIPKIGNKPYKQVTFDDLRKTIRSIEEKNFFAQAKLVANILFSIGRFAKINKWSKHNTADGIKDILQRRSILEKKNLPAITDKAGVAEMLRTIAAYCKKNSITPYTKAALQLFPYLACRGVELLGAKWEEFDLESGIWNIPAERMKARKPHIVYLSKQTKAIFKKLKELQHNELVFPSNKSHLTSYAVNKALHRAGIPKEKMVNHGWRSVLSTLAHNVETGAPHSLIERALAHEEGNAVSQVYNRQQHEKAMRAFYQWWSDYLDALRDDKELPKFSFD